MKAVHNAAPATRVSGHPAATASIARPRRQCAEGCGQAATRIFCSAACRRAWHVREQTRGRMLYPFAVVARVTRAGTRGDIATGKRAHADMDMLIGRWADEDRAAGRTTASAYLALRYRLGLERP